MPEEAYAINVGEWAEGFRNLAAQFKSVAESNGRTAAVLDVPTCELPPAFRADLAGDDGRELLAAVMDARHQLEEAALNLKRLSDRIWRHGRPKRK